MAKYAKDSELNSERIIREALTFFGPNGLGLNVTQHEEMLALFSGGGGFVAVLVCNSGAGSQVEIETREWDRQALGFLRAI